MGVEEREKKEINLYFNHAPGKNIGAICSPTYHIEIENEQSFTFCSCPSIDGGMKTSRFEIVGRPRVDRISWISGRNNFRKRTELYSIGHARPRLSDSKKLAVPGALTSSYEARFISRPQRALIRWRGRFNANIIGFQRATCDENAGNQASHSLPIASRNW